LRSKLKDSRATVEQLTTELSSTKISLHEQQAEAAALRSSYERPASTTLGAHACVHSYTLLCVKHTA
jgi:hypothetical protein